MNKPYLPNINDFCSGHLIVDNDRKIVFCNDYVHKLYAPNESESTQQTGGEPLIGNPISSCFTKASTIFIDSYIYPLLLNETAVQEAQISWLAKDGTKTPVVVNVKLGDNGNSYWSVYICVNRDKLHSELIIAKEQLEAQSKELFLLASTDPLTGLLNRRELSAQAERIAAQVHRNDSTYALLSLDVDYFKKVNDTHGHQAGDVVLQKLAALLLEDRRKNDLIARVGGEEFIILLADIDASNAMKIAEFLRNKVESTSMNKVNITVSIGIAISEKNTSENTITEFQTLLQLSDKALYTSKHQGRNQTTLLHSLN